MGDPAGIGPEILGKTLDEIGDITELYVVVVGDFSLMERYYSGGGKLPLLLHDPGKDICFQENRINFIDPGPGINDVKSGLTRRDSTLKALRSLDMAIDIIKKLPREISKALVTAPVSKQNIANISKGFVGHTEYLQNAFSSKHVTMALVGKSFTAIPVTRHIPVRDIPGKLTRELIIDTLKDVYGNMDILSAKSDPVVCVCSLNPHCGEGGAIGDEEIRVIAPAVESMKAIFKNLTGPVSPDVAFYKAMRNEYDIILGMYHDQCLAPFKMVDFESGVNTTLGLGFVRTSPDHGTAYDIVGKNLANPESMIQAVRLAVKSLMKNTAGKTE
jgi:4-hydroxythreonine-4-phosphate dehydrogenase